jgi:metallophosphoesterase
MGAKNLDVVITVIAVILVVLVWIMLYDSNRFVVRHYFLRDQRIKKPVKAVVLADLHNKRYGKENERLLQAIDEIRPDMILIAGDILTAKPKASLETAVDLLTKLAGKYPIYYGNGNHEHRLKLYPENYGDMAERYEEALQKIGIRRLVNEHTILEESGICIYGSEIDKLYYKRFGIQPMDPEYLKSLLGQPSAEKYTILIAHNPDYFPKYADWGADLVLAGHVHGGMVRVPIWGKGVVSPNVRLFPKYDGGEFTLGKTRMLLSRGLGMHTIPIRLFNPGEVLEVDLLPVGEEAGGSDEGK